MRILTGDMPAGIDKLYEYLLGSKQFKLMNEGIEYEDGQKSATDVARFSGPGSHQVELMSHSSGFQTVSIYRMTQSGRAVICGDIPALVDVEVFKKVYASLWGVRK